MVKTKRSLGQNFLNNKSLAEKITKIVLENKPGTIVEIGTGTGVFTNLFADKVNTVSIEKDEDLFRLIKDHGNLSDVKIINADIFDLDIRSLLSIDPKEVTAFGSLPYNQSKRIIRKMLETGLFRDHFYIIQKEVAEKYLSIKPSNRLSVTRSVFADGVKILDIAPGNFSPKPKVDSSLVHFKKIDQKISSNDLDKFYSFIDQAFSNPRKKLRNNLGKVGSHTLSEELLELRPADLTPSQYIDIFENR